MSSTSTAQSNNLPNPAQFLDPTHSSQLQEEENTFQSSIQGSETSEKTQRSRQLKLSDYLDLHPVSQFDWEAWISGEDLSEASLGAESLAGLDRRAVGEFPGCGHLFASLKLPIPLERSQTHSLSFLLRFADFWSKHGYLPPPVAPKKQRRQRRQVMRRYGLNNPTTLLPVLSRTCSIVRRLFDVEFAAFTIAACDSLEEVHVVGGFQDEVVTPMAKNGSVCSHALEQPEFPDVFHIEDMNKDWRFAKNPNLCFPNSTKRLGFYASVPLSLAIGGQPMVVGTLCVLSQHKKDWSQTDTDSLKSLSAMTSESIKLTSTNERTKRTAIIQRSQTFLTRSIDETSLIEHTLPRNGSSTTTSGTSSTRPTTASSSTSVSETESVGSVAQTSDGYQYSQKRCHLACSHLQSVLQATSVLAVDISDFKIFDLPSIASPRSSFSPSSSSSSLLATSTQSDSETNREFQHGNGTAQITIHSLHQRTDSASTSDRPSFEQSSTCPIPSNGPNLISGVGFDSQEVSSSFTSKLTREQVSAWLTEWKLNKRKSLPVLYDLSKHQEEDDESDEDDKFDENEKDVERNVGRNGDHDQNPLSSLLPGPTETYLALPIFNLQGQPMFMLLACFEKRAYIEQDCLLFLESTAMVIRSSIIRQQIHAAEQAASHFIQQVQVSDRIQAVADRV